MAIPDRSDIKEGLIRLIVEKGGHRSSITPKEAYRLLASKFRLTREDLEKEREFDNLWKNEVRWARQDLVTEGVLLPTDQSGYGVWQLSPSWDATSESLQRNAQIRKTELEQIADDLTDEGVFDPATLTDARDIILRAIVQRRGQQEFRKQVLKEYGLRCAITDETCQAVLEAAHIVPYQGALTNDIRNGILLRSDIHTLFDLHFIAIDRNYCVRTSPSLLSTSYYRLGGQMLRLPVDVACHPSLDALKQHESECDF